MKFSFAVLSSLVLVTVVGCSKPTPAEQKKKEDEIAAAIASTLSAVAPPSTATAAGGAGGASGASGAGSDKILGQCLHKESSSCEEISGVFGFAEEESCKGLDGSGVFTKGDNPCPKENRISSCESVGGEQRKTTYHYLEKGRPLAEQRANTKVVCGFTDGKYSEIAVTPAAPKAPAKKAASAPAAPKAKK